MISNIRTDKYFSEIIYKTFIMEIKRNEATINRPEGDRVIDAPFVFIDLPGFISQLKEEEAWKKNDRNGITVFKTGNMTIVLTALHAGAEILDNDVNGIVTLQVLEGTARITTTEADIEAKEKNIVTLHPNVRHSVKALSDTVLLLTNCDLE